RIETPHVGQPAHAAPPHAPESRTAESAEGVSRARQILTAAAGARWPMYLRNVKQIPRQADGGFDERRYGFGGLMDLLKALQRDGRHARPRGGGRIAGRSRRRRRARPGLQKKKGRQKNLPRAGRPAVKRRRLPMPAAKRKARE